MTSRRGEFEVRKANTSAVGGNKEKGRDWTRVRLAFVAVLFGLAWAALWARAFQVQVLDGEELASRAERQHVSVEFASGKRGRILDRNGRVLAKSVAVNSVFVRPDEVREPRRAARELSRILDEPIGGLLKKLTADKSFVWIVRGIGDKPAAEIRNISEPGLHMLVEYGRTYPNGHLAGQLIGFVGLDGDGLEGVERSFDKHLAGRRVAVAVQKDAGGSSLYLEGGPDAAGSDLTLTLDADIQFMAEEALAAAVTDNDARYGVMLVIEVESAEVLAWAQYPFFNPNVFREYDPAAWRNRGALDALEPGSTMKPVLVAAALQEGVVREDTEYFCEEGEWGIRGATFGDTHEYGLLPVSKIVRYSSNIGAAKIGLDLGARIYHDYLSRLGFGDRSEIPLPGENPGILRPASRWTRVDLAAASFGQGLAATPLQLAQAYLCLASDGVFRPLRISRGGGATASRSRRVFSKKVAGSVLSMLRDVVQEDGTGTAVRIPGLEVGGKTGTAQKASPEGGYSEKYVASFVGLFPALEPKYLVLAVVDEPEPHHYGGVVAAPAVRRTALGSLSYLGKLPDAVQGGEGDEKSVANPEEPARTRVFVVHDVAPVPGRVPDVVGLPVRRAVEAFVRAGRVPSVKGSGGFVARQSPGAGRKWPGGGRPVLWLTGRGGGGGASG
jgi:cell division protein FtsI (penicillin-binding protein 3)